MKKIVVIGSIFVDVKGFAFQNYVPTGRNIGSVKFVHGGVCRNAAENIAQLGLPVSFVTLFENTGIGDESRSRLMSRGVCVDDAVYAQDGMGMWLAVMDEKGDLAGSISKQPVFTALEELLETDGDRIVSECDCVVLEVDTTERIARKVFDLAAKYNRDIYVVVGNMGVIRKCPDLIPRTALTVMNEIEASILFDREVRKDRPDEVLSILKTEAEHRGIRRMIITLGSYGSVWYDGVSNMAGTTEARPTKVVDTTGAGDAFFSGAAAALSQGRPIDEAAKLGTLLASLTLQSSESTFPVEEYRKVRLTGNE